MANSIEDLTYLYDILTHQQIATELSHISTSYRVGILNLNSFPNKKEDEIVLNKLTKVLQENGHQTLNVTIDYQPVSNSDTLYYEFKSSLNHYLKQANYPAAHSLNDIIEFNKTNKKRLLKYGQTLLEKSEATSGDLNDPKYIDLRKNLLEKASLFDDLMNTHQLDALVSTHWLPESLFLDNRHLFIL